MGGHEHGADANLLTAALTEIRAAGLTSNTEVQALIGSGGGTGATMQTKALGILRAGLANRLVSPCRIAVVGSSTPAGQGASTAANRFANRLVTAIQAAYPSGSGTETTVIASTSAAFGTLSPAPGVHGYNAGQGGTTSSNYLVANEITAIGALNPRLVLHMVGSNDWDNGVAVAMYKANVKARIADLKAATAGPCCHLLVHSYPKNDGSPGTYPWASYGAALAEIAAEDPTAVAFVDLSGDYALIGIPGADPLGFLTRDQVHQGDSGHAYMADLLLESLGLTQPTTTVTVGPVSPPGTPVVTAASGVGRVTISGSSTGATSYKVFRLTSAGVATTGTPIATPATLPYADTTGTTGTTYYYRLFGVNTAGESAASNEVSGASSAVPPAFLNDSITDTDGTLLSAHAAELGGTYLKAQVAGDFTIVGSAGRAYVSTATALLRSPATPPTANYTVTAGIDFLTIPTTGVSIGPVARCTTTGAGYTARYDYASGQWRIDRLSGAATSSTKGAYAATLSPGLQSVGIRVGTNGDLGLVLNGSEVITAVDASPITAAGSVAIIGTATDSSATTGSLLTSLVAA